MGHYSPVWVPGAIASIDTPQGAFTSWSSTPAVLADSGPLHGLLITVSWAINHHFRFPERFSPLTNPRCIYVLVINTRSFGRFWPITWATNYRFMGHYSPVWVPGAISSIDEPQGAFTSWSSTPAVLADSGPLHGLLITVSWAINHHFRFPERFSPLTNPRCIYVLVINTRSFGRFWPITCATNYRFMGHYSPVWVPGAISSIDEPQGAFTSWSSTPAVLADSGPLHGLLITVSWAINPHFRFPEGFSPLTNPRCIYVLVINTRSFGRFWPITLATNYRFMGHYSPVWVPGAISSIDEAQCAFRPCHQHSQFWPILAHYMGY